MTELSTILEKLASTQSTQNSRIQAVGDSFGQFGLFNAIRNTSGVITIDEFDGSMFIDTSAIPSTINLPSAIGIGGRLYFITDTGNALINNITILPSGIETISGAASLLININYGHVILISNGANWFSWL